LLVSFDHRPFSPSIDDDDDDDDSIDDDDDDAKLEGVSSLSEDVTVICLVARSRRSEPYLFHGHEGSDIGTQNSSRTHVWDRVGNDVELVVACSDVGLE
jgi:hypothetical protein